ncbi:MAG: permease [Cyanobacteria bacterium]|nr:permease [Cyanobacteriota bacterium]MDW8200850.1 permease [Cyanobacteriota bacterium SKYGB_h_bin112]
MKVEQLSSAFTLFLSLLVEAMPFLLLGVLFSGVLLFFVDERKLIATLPKHPLLGSIIGSCIGFLFPVCECGNVPVARRLLMQGVSPAVAIGFLLAAPTVNPVVVWATWIAFRDQPEIVAWRVGLSLGIAIVIAWIFSAQTDMRPLLQPAVTRIMPATPRTEKLSADGTALLQSGTFLLGGRSGSLLQLDTPEMLTQVNFSVGRLPLGKKLGLLLDNTIQEFRELAGVLVIGSAIAASIQVFVPRDWILSLGQGPMTSVLAMMGLAAVVSICSTVDAFFALSFASIFTTGSLLAFLVFGPMIDLKAIGLMLSIFRPRAIIYLFLLAGQLTLLATLFLNLYVS